MSSREEQRSHIRLFVSVDIAGSTALKNELNHKTLRSWVKATCKAREVESADEIPEHLFPAAIEVDWAAILEDLFQSFHSTFVTQIGSRLDSEERAGLLPVSPWKALGDELIYSFRVRSDTQLSKLVYAFLATIRIQDELCAEKKRVRLKGSAWVAGFPLRNRVIRLPMPDLVLQDEPSRAYPYPKEDYLGPDMDIGFRLGKCSFPGMCVASMGLVELLAKRDSSEQIGVAQVGWEVLKGVWGERPYPIFWLDTPTDEKSSPPVPRPVIRKWSEAESSFLAKWVSYEKIPEAKFVREACERIRRDLPEQLGIIAPYIPGPEQSGIPDDDCELLELYPRLKRGPAGEQEFATNASPASNAQLKLLGQFIEKLLRPDPTKKASRALSQASKRSSTKVKRGKPNP